MRLNVFLLILTIFGHVGLFDCNENGISSQELSKMSREMVKKIKEAVSLFSNLIKVQLNSNYVRHLLYHPFHRLHKKHLLHRQRKHPKRKTNKRPQKRRLTSNSN